MSLLPTEYPGIDYPAAVAAALCEHFFAEGRPDTPGALADQLGVLRKRWPRMSDEEAGEGVVLFGRLLMAQQLGVLAQIERGPDAGPIN